MTNVTWTQAPEAPWSVDLDPIDLLVPPPRSFRRSLLLAGVAVLVVVVVVAISSSGLVRPKLGLTQDASYTAAGLTRRPSLTFNVQNEGRFPLSIGGVDARVAGLRGARVTIASLGPDGELGPSHGFPLTVQGGRVAHITMTFVTWNCREIEPHDSDTVPLHLSGPLETVRKISALHWVNSLCKGSVIA
jgi:hypothetical protein